jgi:hypothetical protein
MVRRPLPRLFFSATFSLTRRRPAERNYKEEACAALPRAVTAAHPLLPEEKQQKTMKTTRIGGDDSPSSATPEPKAMVDPLGVLAPAKVSFDPLGVVKSASPAFFDPLGVTGGGGGGGGGSGSAKSMPDAPFTAAPTIMERAVPAEHKADAMEEMIEEGFVPWSSKKGAVLQKYTTNESVGILASFMQDVPNRVNMPVDTTQRRLHELERGEDDEERQLEVSQQEYVRHIESLHGALRNAWDQEQNRVLALKIVIRCAKVLGDTSVIQFYPSKFVLISEILDSFGDLVYDRIRERGAVEDAQGRMRELKADFTAEDVNDYARETCKNWFHKVASIRELLPRVYVEMALLHCYRFIYNDPFETLLTRINMQLRGVCDPLVATYARAYLARVGSRVKPRLKPYLVTGFVDHLEVMKQNIDSGLITRICKDKNIDPLKYYDLYSPALDWMLQCLAHNNRSQATLMAILGKFKVMGDALTLNHIIRNFHPDVAAQHCLLFSSLIQAADDRGLKRERLWSSFGASLIMSPPSPGDAAALWKEVWTDLLKEQDLVTFVNLAEIWIEFPVKYLVTPDDASSLTQALKQLLERVKPEKGHQAVQDQLQSMAQKILSGFPDYTHVARLDVFHEFVDLFSGEHQVQVHKAILRSFRAFQGASISDPLLIEHVFTAAKSAHDSINTLSFDDERRQVSELLCSFVTKVDFGRNVEKQLTFLSDARRAFGNFDTVKARLVHAVAALTMRTLSIVGGVHTERTAPFVRACVANLFITIPSIESVFVRLELYLVAANVALQNGAIGQAEDLCKAAVKLFGESIPPHPSDLDLEVVRAKCRAKEEQMLEFVLRFASLLVVIPGHPELGPFYLFGGLLKVLSAFQWLPGSEVPCRVAMALLGTLCALAQETLPYHIRNLESNNVLYGGDPMYLEELYKLVDAFVQQILDQLTVLKTTNPASQALLAAEFFDVTVSLANLNAKSGNLVASLFAIAKTSAEPPTYLRSAFAALKFRTGPLHHALATKLQV